MLRPFVVLPIALSTLWTSPSAPADEPICISGRYPHLAMFNDNNECGTGAVVPWAGKLWVVTYAPHDPRGGDDKLYEIDASLRLVTRPESIGGTPANRMIHRESQQLFIGPYAIDASGKVRVIPYTKALGRPTATARHLFDPARKVYLFTMEEGLYEIDVKTLDVTTIHLDGHAKGHVDYLPGYHGKGGYSGQGRLVVANNGYKGKGMHESFYDFAGSLSEWDGESWKIVHRDQHCEVTGPGGIYGNGDPANDPIWATGWDKRSVVVQLRDDGEWSTFRVPFADYSYVARHGWHTEWPRIREVVPAANASDKRAKLMMNMHGGWFDFPPGFSQRKTAGLRPIATHVKITGDFCAWNGRVVFACDDTARSAFSGAGFDTMNRLNGQSQSNLWFTTWDGLRDAGRPVGWGGVWLHDEVEADEASGPYLFAGYTDRVLHLTHGTRRAVRFTVEVDRAGDGTWSALRSIDVPATGYRWVVFDDDEAGQWARVRTDRAAIDATAYFHYGLSAGAVTDGEMFASLAEANTPGAHSTGVMRARGADMGTLHFVARQVDASGEVTGSSYYEIGPDMRLTAKPDDTATRKYLEDRARVQKVHFSVDDASIVLVENGKRFRLPKGTTAYDDKWPDGWPRDVREVVTERSLINAHGTFYMLPRTNSGGVAGIKPICTHGKRISDFCSWRGLLVLAGTKADAKPDGHYVPGSDGKSGLWFGDVDDLWKMGKPRGRGGPWANTRVEANRPSDPYLMTGYDKKTLVIRHDARDPVTFTIEVDVIRDGTWLVYRTLSVDSGETRTHRFPDGYAAHWVRLKADMDCETTAMFEYE